MIDESPGRTRRLAADPRTGRRTKIVATIGPATRETEQMAELIEAGADVFRLNFSHGTARAHAENVARARAASRRTGVEVGIIGDLPGPKLRLGSIADGAVGLRTGERVTLTTRPVAGNAKQLPVTWKGLPAAVRPGGEVYLADGRIRLRVLDQGDGEVRTAVEVGGRVASHQGLNLPGADVALPAAGRDDLAWVEFALEQELDAIAVSFVRSAADLVPVLERIEAHGTGTPVIAKIEKPEAADAAEEIVRACLGGIMVARGDLGIELPLERVPSIQRRLLSLAGSYARPSITATQMLASMVDSPRPTRAEVSDVAAAIQQGTDAVMLSEETAIGSYPVEAVRTMARIAVAAEPDLPYAHWLTGRVRTDGEDIAASVARAAVSATETLGLAALLVPTNSGRTARLVSAHRPRVPVLAVTPRLDTARRLQALFGVRCAVAAEGAGLTELLEDCSRLAKEWGLAADGELIGITAGLPEQQLGTNLFEVHRVS